MLWAVVDVVGSVGWVAAVLHQDMAAAQLGLSGFEVIMTGWLLSVCCATAAVAGAAAANLCLCAFRP
jgi:hypothetical protein